MWQHALQAYGGYLVGSAVNGANAAAQQQPGSFALLWAAFVTVLVLLGLIVIINIACCASLCGVALGFAFGRGRKSAVPGAAVEATALAGEVVALSTEAAASAARRRLRGYRDKPVCP